MLTGKSRFPIREIILFGFLPSFLKKSVYRLRGYRIGKGVRIGMGSVICGKSVEIGKCTSIGFLTIIRGHSIRVGNHVEIGSLTILDSNHLEIGDGTKINEQVFVGGLQFPDSRLVIGRNCQIMQMTFINPARSITIGDDTGIGGDCLIFGHTSWLSKFEGYPVDFRAIEIGSSVSLAWRVFVLAGAKIGDGVVIGANSVVNHVIPPRCLAVGSPARVVSKAPYFPRNVTEEEKVDYLRGIVDEMTRYWEGHGLHCRRNGSFCSVTDNRRGWRLRPRTWQMQIEYEPLDGSFIDRLPHGLHVVLSLRRLSQEIRVALARRACLWIDIESKERSDFGNELGEEVVLFLRRYGLRLFRVSS